MKTVNILGANYKIEFAKASDDKNIGDGTDAYCDWTTKRIVLQDPKDSDGNLGNMSAYWKKTLRHEIIHAFMFESGLAQNSLPTDAWAQNEEMVDWFAFNGPKIYAVWKRLNALDEVSE